MRIKRYLFLASFLVIISAFFIRANYLNQSNKAHVLTLVPVLIASKNNNETGDRNVDNFENGYNLKSETPETSTSSETAINADLNTDSNTSADTGLKTIVSTSSGPAKNNDTNRKPTDPSKIVKLEVPYFKQQYNNSCEAASLRMALAFYGIKVDDDLDIVQKFGYTPKLKDVINNIWDNPNEMFVGDINAVGSTTGYGVYSQPVVKTAISYGKTDSYDTKVITSQLLAKEIKAGHPVILWGYTSITTVPYTWNLTGGGEVTAFKGEHARLVVGFAGDITNPDGFYVHDPFNDRQYEYWPTDKLIDQVYAVDGITNQAVIVK